MRNGWLDWAIIFTLGALVLGVMVALALSAEPDRGAWFKSLKMPGTKTSCCDVADCKKTEAEWKGDGWTAIVRGVWRNIPDEKVLEHPKSLDGEAYVCSADISAAAKEEYRAQATIFCFIPPSMSY